VTSLTLPSIEAGVFLPNRLNKARGSKSPTYLGW
jgi:hypothetical protein